MPVVAGLTAAATVLLVQGCGSTTSNDPTSASPVPGTTTRTAEPTEDTTMRIRLTIDGRATTAILNDTATARDLADQLPLTLTFRDLNGVEKIGKLPRPLTTQGVPAGADPDVNDIGYYAPSGDLVLYYGDVGYWDGIVRIGRFDDDIESLQRQPDGFEMTIEPA
jgi:hypothetical protein